MVEAIRAAGGEVYGITSEPQSLAQEAEQAWGISIPIIGDPHHEIRKDLKSRGWLDVFHNADYGHLRLRSWADHPNGYFQPATIAFNREGRILYRWRCVPRYSNMSGAGARPEANYAWQHIREALDGYDDAPLDPAPTLGSPELPWWKFLAMLTAHGWFLRPRAFPLTREGGKDEVTPKQAMRRWYWFGGAWLLAGVLLPPLWVGAALLVWLAALAPGLLEIHRQFQNEPDPV